MKLTKNLKWAVGTSTLLVMLAVVPVVQGGGRWSGIDPELQYGGHTVNIRVEWPEENTCEINRTIQMDIYAPGATLVGESTGTLTCADGTVATLDTATSIKDSGKEGHLKVANVEVLASEDFPVKLMIYVDGVLRSSCTGESNHAFHCGAGRVIQPKE